MTDACAFLSGPRPSSRACGSPVHGSPTPSAAVPLRLARPSALGSGNLSGAGERRQRTAAFDRRVVPGLVALHRGAVFVRPGHRLPRQTQPARCGLDRRHGNRHVRALRRKGPHCGPCTTPSCSLKAASPPSMRCWPAPSSSGWPLTLPSDCGGWAGHRLLRPQRSPRHLHRQPLHPRMWPDRAGRCRWASHPFGGILIGTGTQSDRLAHSLVQQTAAR